MKKYFTIIALFTLLLGSEKVMAQQICMVTADYQTGENYLILWEQFTDLTGLDSVLFYRQDPSVPYTFIGGEKIDPAGVTYYQDTTSDAKVTAKYVMYVKDSAGIITGPSEWHQPITIDYQSAGTFSFVPYQKENGTMYYYNAYYDATGLGFFQYLNTTVNYTNNTFVDTGYVSHPDAYYYLESYIQPCNVQTKAEINTSRSNIKQQIATAALGIENVKKEISFSISPNPVSTELLIQMNGVSNANVWVTNLMGEVCLKSRIESTSAKINMEKLESGVYLIHVNSNDYVSSMKFVKQ